VLAAGVAAVLLTGAGTAVADPGQARPGACGWTAGALPTPAGTTRSQVHATDGKGRFAGEVSDDGFRTRPALWRNGRYVELGAPFGSDGATAADVGRHGDVVGSGPDPARGGESRAFLWTGGRYVPLAEPAGVQSSAATGVSDAGTVVGWAATDSGTVGLVWSVRRPGTVTVVRSDRPLRLSGITDRGVAFGSAGTETVDGTAVTWTPRTGLRPLAVPAGVQESAVTGGAGRYFTGWWFSPDAGSSQNTVWVAGRPRPLAGPDGATAVNAHGRLAGGAFGTAYTWRSPSAQPVALPALGGPDANAGATAVTDDGRVAGWSSDGTSRAVATVWTCR
jgi:hypothetical protein